jgi:hypothetical protein
VPVVSAPPVTAAGGAAGDPVAGSAAPGGEAGLAERAQAQTRVLPSVGPRGSPPGAAGPSWRTDRTAVTPTPRTAPAGAADRLTAWCAGHRPGRGSDTARRALDTIRRAVDFRGARGWLTTDPAAGIR